MERPKRFETKLIHSGSQPRVQGAITTPIFQSSTYVYDEQITYDDIKYIRLNNTPNHKALHQKLADLESGEAALVSASGMATISSVLLAFLKAGDHILLQNSLYGGTHGLASKILPPLGIEVEYFDSNKPEEWQAKLKPSTKVIYVETVSNPTLEIPDLEGIVAFAKANRLISIIDNTFASPVNFRPLELGFDLSLHSATKYLNGHSDLVAGCVIGSKSHIQLINTKQYYLGGALDPHTCFLLERGIKTLAVRVRQQNESAMKIARFLSEHNAISQVIYPGLESHPQFARARDLFDGFGGMVSFRPVGGVKAAENLVKKVQIPAHAPSLGGVESLITRPAGSIHANMTPEDRKRMGIHDDLIRFSIGLEASEDLIEDLDTGLG